MHIKVSNFTRRDCSHLEIVGAACRLANDLLCGKTPVGVIESIRAQHANWLLCQPEPAPAGSLTIRRIFYCINRLFACARETAPDSHNITLAWEKSDVQKVSVTSCWYIASTNHSPGFSSAFYHKSKSAD